MIAGNRGRLEGFTLIELLVTIAVAVILATVAIPGFQSLMANSRHMADVNSIIAGLNYARNEAVKRRKNVDFVLVAAGPPWKYEVERLSETGSEVLRSVESSNNRVAINVVDEFVVGFNSLGRSRGGNCDNGCEIKIVSDAVDSFVCIGGLGGIKAGSCGGGG